MKCPACGRSLEQLTHHDVTLDVCREGCGGVWFDNFELKKFDEPTEEAGDLLSLVKKDPSNTINYGDKRKCPKCEMPMQKHLFSPIDRIEIDECPKCAGVWLDAGELAAIRSQAGSEEERREASRRYLNKVCEPLFQKLEEENAEQRACISRVIKALRFICPSYYLPGKQSWGAF